jgi:flagellar biosynthesis anti-sigma factor FlgM
MRIADPNSSSNTLPAETAALQPAAHAQQNGAAGTTASGSDRTELSGLADRLTELLRGDSASRAQRIAQLKEAVANGTYHVDAAAVSRAIVDEALSAADSTSN